MRSLLKRLAEPLSAGLAWHARARATREGVLVLAYHNVRPPGEAPSGEHSLHIAWRSFIDHLDMISTLADLVPLAEAHHAGEAHPRLRVALTFDDAYAGAVDLALPELVRRGIPATVFVAPGLLDGRSSWWDQLAEPAGGTLSDQLRGHALEQLRGQQEVIRMWSHENGVPWVDSMPEWATGASSTEVVKAAFLPGIELGAHSWSHPNLRSLDAEELGIELRTPIEWLLSHGFGRGKALAYPYGLAHEGTMRAARDAGYTSAFMVSGGFLQPSASAHSLPRLNVPAGLTPAGLKLRLAGRLIT